MKTSTVLLKAMDIIATPDKWTKEACARNLDGTATGSLSNDAVCFCSLGALKKVGEKVFDSKATSYLSKSVPPNHSVPSFNDAKKTTHADVMEKFMTAYFLAVADGE